MLQLTKCFIGHNRIKISRKEAGQAFSTFFEQVKQHAQAHEARKCRISRLEGIIKGQFLRLAYNNHSINIAIMGGMLLSLLRHSDR